MRRAELIIHSVKAPQVMHSSVMRRLSKCRRRNRSGQNYRSTQCFHANHHNFFLSVASCLVVFNVAWDFSGREMKAMRTTVTATLAAVRIAFGAWGCEQLGHRDTSLALSDFSGGPKCNSGSLS
jgi:hypothetical protein